VRFGNHSAHKISPAEFEEQDLVIVMDRSNLRWLERIVGDYTNVAEGEVLKDSDIRGKVHMMMEFAGLARDVADPWYTGDFEQTYQDVLAGCKGLLTKIKL
jgi:protein-tyrosine phosphatase